MQRWHIFEKICIISLKNYFAVVKSNKWRLYSNGLEGQMFERIEYIVGRIDGDYAFLNQTADPQAEEKCVARALLPESIGVGTKLAYEMMQYEMIEG